MNLKYKTLGAGKLSVVLDMTTKTNEALEAGMSNLVTKLITNISEHVMLNDVSKQLGNMAKIRRYTMTRFI